MVGQKEEREISMKKILPDHCPEGARIGIKIDPDGIHVMKKSAYSGMFGDYSSFSEEYDELDDATLSSDEEESGDEE